MKNTFLKPIFVIALAMMMTFTITFSVVSGQEATDNQSADSPNAPDRTIVGVWQTTVTQRNCMTGEPVAPSVQGVFTFNEGGTLAEFAGSSPLRSQGHGIWEASNPFHPTLAFTLLRFNAEGTFGGRTVVRLTVSLAQSGNNYTTTGTVEIFAPNGMLVGMGCATSTATRFQ